MLSPMNILSKVNRAKEYNMSQQRKKRSMFCIRVNEKQLARYVLGKTTLWYGDHKYRTRYVTSPVKVQQA